MRTGKFLAIGAFVGVAFITIANALHSSRNDGTPVQQAGPTPEVRQAKSETELGEATLALHAADLSFPIDDQGFPDYFRRHVAALVRWEKAELAANGSDWKAKLNGEWNALAYSTGVANGMPKDA